MQEIIETLKREIAQLQHRLDVQETVVRLLLANAPAEVKDEARRVFLPAQE
jgi:DNA-binding transcriptional regulator/RsmH inhibitor MraZ